MTHGWTGGMMIVLLIGAVFISGCNKEVNPPAIEIKQGNSTGDLVEDMQYRPVVLPLQSDIKMPHGLLLQNHSVGVLKDGNLLFQGKIRNEQDTPVQGYIIVYLDILGNNSRTLVSGYPVVSPRNIPANGEFDYFYVTGNPVVGTPESYLMVVQVADRYPGV